MGCGSHNPLPPRKKNDFSVMVLLLVFLHYFWCLMNFFSNNFFFRRHLFSKISEEELQRKWQQYKIFNLKYQMKFWMKSILCIVKITNLNYCLTTLIIYPITLSLVMLKGLWSGKFFFRKKLGTRGTSKKKIWLGTFFKSVLTIFISFSGLVIDTVDSYMLQQFHNCLRVSVK